nr:arsenite methyltransferase [Haloarchaeobius iranensis]
MTETPAATRDDADQLDAKTQRTAVRERYGRIAAESGSCCDDTASCCGETAAEDTQVSTQHGYSADDLAAVAGDANLNLGCGNPTAIASLDAGDTVLDLGSGGGFDCFLAAREVGPDGHVVGVDMTPEMVETARDNVAANDASNVEFRLGEIEHLPVADASVDVVISNCVVNLSPDKPQVFREAYRVLRPGGRVAISDVVLTADLPTDLRTDPESVAACVAGAATISALESMLTEAGFVHVTIEPKADSDEFIREWDDALDLSEYIVAATIEAERPEAGA